MNSVSRFSKCLTYLAVLGIVSQFVGMLLPRKLFKSDGLFFRSYFWEKDGSVYEKLGVRRWKDKLPDMSRLFKNTMVPKRFENGFCVKGAEDLVKETCVAESVHCGLALFGFLCVFIWRGIGGKLVWASYALANLPFIIVQRYNRPRLKKTIIAVKNRQKNI